MAPKPTRGPSPDERDELFREVERLSSRLHVEVVMTYAFRNAEVFIPNGTAPFINLNPINKALREELKLLKCGMRGDYGDDLRNEVRETFKKN